MTRDADSQYSHQYCPSIGSAEGTPQYKSLLDAPYMPRDAAEKLEELNNPQPLQPQVRKLRRVTTMVPFKNYNTKAKALNVHQHKETAINEKDGSNC